MRSMIVLAMLGGLIGCTPDPGKDEVQQSAAQERENAAINPEDGATLRLEIGAPFEVIVESNPTTGYYWYCEVTSNAQIAIEDDTYIADPAPEGLVGSGGRQVFTLLAEAAGDGEMACSHQRSPQDVIETLQLKLVAD